ncbi:MAG: hypothetical protein ACON4Z_15540, partial [Planctomycetota bacterium]
MERPRAAQTACSAALGCALLLAWPACGAVDGAPIVALHVALSGDDDQDGSAARPYRSVARAQRAVRGLRSGGLDGPLTVWLHEGVHELAAPLEFDAADSGARAAPTTYAAAPGADAVLSGGRRVRGWREVRPGLWQATLPEVAAGRWFFRHLTVDGRRARRARWPDAGVARLRTVSADVTGFSFDRTPPPGDLASQRAELVVLENWSVTRGVVAERAGEQVKTASPMGWIGHGPATTASPGKAAWLENARELLTQPGEWSLDPRSGELSYLALPGEDPSAHTVVVAPRLEHLVQVAGSREAPVRHLRFDGIRFSHTAFPLPAAGYREIQAAHHGTTLGAPTFVQPVAFACQYAEDLRISGCRFAHLGASGVGVGAGCARAAIVGSAFDDLGGTGVIVGWRARAALAGGKEGGLDADWLDPRDAPRATEVADCEVRRCGQDSFGAVGVFVAFSADTRVAHNHVHDLPYTRISVGYRWNTTPTSQVRCVVEHNHIHDVMQLLADGGGVYTLGLQPGTVLRQNYVHDVHRSGAAHGGAPNNGFFLDQGSKGYLLEGNVVRATSGAPVRFNLSERGWHQWRGNFFGDAAAVGEAP